MGRLLDTMFIHIGNIMSSFYTMIILIIKRECFLMITLFLMVILQAAYKTVVVGEMQTGSILIFLNLCLQYTILYLLLFGIPYLLYYVGKNGFDKGYLYVLTVWFLFILIELVYCKINSYFTQKKFCLDNFIFFFLFCGYYGLGYGMRVWIKKREKMFFILSFGIILVIYFTTYAKGLMFFYGNR